MKNVSGVDNGFNGFNGFSGFSGFSGFAAFFEAMPEGRREEVRSQMSNA